MKMFALPLLALAALTGGALAQPKPATPAMPPPAATTPAPDDDAGGPPPPSDAGPGSAQASQPDAPPPPRPMPPDGPRGHRPPPPPPSKAAHFRLGRGDTMVDVKCAEDEPMKACADLAIQLLDHLQAPKN